MRVSKGGFDLGGKGLITGEAEMERPREFVREGPRTREMEEREVKVEC